MRQLTGEEVRVTWFDATSNTEEEGGFTLQVADVVLKEQLVRTRGKLLKVGRLNLVLATDDSSMMGSVHESSRGFYRIPKRLVVLVEKLEPTAVVRGPLASLMGKAASTTARRRGK